MKSLAIMAVLTCYFSLSAYAQQTGQPAGSEFDAAAPESDSATIPLSALTPAQRIVYQTMEKQCDKQTGQCWLAGLTSKGSTWKLTLSAGVGNSNFSSGTGTTVILDGSGNNTNSRSPYYSVAFSVGGYNCQTDLLVSPSQKYRIEMHQQNGVNPDGSLKKDFSLAENRIDRVYATLISKLENCRPQNQ